MVLAPSAVTLVTPIHEHPHREMLDLPRRQNAVQYSAPNQISLKPLRRSVYVFHRVLRRGLSAVRYRRAVLRGFVVQRLENVVVVWRRQKRTIPGGWIKHGLIWRQQVTDIIQAAEIFSRHVLNDFVACTSNKQQNHWISRPPIFKLLRPTIPISCNHVWTDNICVYYHLLKWSFRKIRTLGMLRNRHYTEFRGSSPSGEQVGFPLFWNKKYPESSSPILEFSRCFRS